MKHLPLLICCFLLLQGNILNAQFCNGTGNVVIFANYDGGILNINVDQNIPNLKIGICTYEATTINITGPYAGNVTAVQYAGFNSNNNHCEQVIANTTISGVSSSITEILFAPPATLPDVDGYGSIICAYSCGAGNQGGCNTAEQIVDYFINEFGGSLLMYYTQYGCWPSTSIPVSGGGTCCPGVSGSAPVADISLPTGSFCPGDCLNFSDASTNNPTSWSWSFQGAQVSTSSNQNPTSICYALPGTYQVALTASNASGSTTAIEYITIDTCPISGCTYQQAINYNPDATIDDHSCVFLCTSCPGDFNGDNFISVTDLLEFIAVFGTACPN